MTDHLYGDEPECALCGHVGPDTDPQPCLSQLAAGELVHRLKRAVVWWQSATGAAAADRGDEQLEGMAIALGFAPSAKPTWEAIRQTAARLHQESCARAMNPGFSIEAIAAHKLSQRVDGLLESNNRYLEEARIAKRVSAVTSTALSAAQVQIQVLREALEFYADEDNYDDLGICGTVTTAHDPTSVGSGPEQETHPDCGVTAEQALQDVFGAERQGAKP